ncbi:hemopexin-like [Lampris incognitus]|uniref:hemopexin-like n=1 Tax=Lampris incognitus TaxID=2546036 RepID=UPI0024B5CFF4|nr:hemopexin-like [Lampris incognitus]
MTDLAWKHAKQSVFRRSDGTSFKEDLTTSDKAARGHLWPGVEKTAVCKNFSIRQSESSSPIFLYICALESLCFFCCTGRLSSHTDRERCSQVPLDAVASDGLGRGIAFRGDYFLREDEGKSWHAFPTAEFFKEVKSDVDAAFSHAGLLYILKNDQVFAYKSGERYDLVEGYPKSLQEELGIEGPLDAAFHCEGSPVLFAVKDGQLFVIELGTPKVVMVQYVLPFPKVDAGMCGPSGVNLFAGAEIFMYQAQIWLISRNPPEPHKLSLEMFGCDH